MASLKKNKKLILTAVLFLGICSATVAAQVPSAELRGQVRDEVGAAVVGVIVTLENKDVAARTTQTDGEGEYKFIGLQPGTYKLVAQSNGFARYENEAVRVTSQRTATLDLTLSVAAVAVSMTVADRNEGVGVDPERDASTLSLKGADLETLPDDPDELAATLQAMSGFPGSAQFYLDGFQASNLPPKRNIREVRINQNPFSAEFDHLGTNRIDIFTKPGTERFHGQTFFTFSDKRFNAGDPFGSTQAPFHSRLISASISGPVLKKNSSFLADFERREIDDYSIVKATILNPSLDVTPLDYGVATPQRRTSFALRMDQTLSRNNTLVVRYSYLGQDANNSGVGGFSLPARAFKASQASQNLQVTETAVLSNRAVDETRFLFVRDRYSRTGNGSIPTINVLDSFIDGGSGVGNSLNSSSHWELQNNAYFRLRKHEFKAGLQVRAISVDDISSQDFGGTFTFAGGSAVQLDENGNVVYTNGVPQFIFLTSLERYRRTLLFGRQGLPANAGNLTFSNLGIGPSQFSITAGVPAAHATQLYFGGFFQDEWNARPNLTLSAGLRYEKQNLSGSNLDFAPRLRFAWAPSGSLNRQRKTVIRGGMGVFYSQLDSDLTLQSVHFNGVNEQRQIITDPAMLQSFPRLPDLSKVDPALIPQAIVRVADDLRTPYTIQTAVGVDRELPHKTLISVTYLFGRSLHLLRSRNINAPFVFPSATNALGVVVRPLGGINNVFEYESSGKAINQQLLIRFNTRFGSAVNLFGSYILNQVKSDTDGPSSFPSNSYDLNAEYGRSLLDVRQHFFIGGTIKMGWGIDLSPLIIASSGHPFNIITGRDTNGDSLFTERPSLATNLNKPGIIITPLGAFDPDPDTGQPVIPRNFGTGPAFFTVNLRISKTINFGKERRASSVPQKRKESDLGGEAAGGNIANGNVSERRYHLTFSVRTQNLFNRVNAGIPVGNLSSLLFGQSISSAGTATSGTSPTGGSRRVEAQIGFSF